MSVYDNYSKTIGIPVVVSINTGEGILIEYTNENESEILDGIHNFILNILKYCDEFDQIMYIDPVRYNNSSLGILQPLAVGGKSVIDNVPLSIDEVRKRLII